MFEHREMAHDVDFLIYRPCKKVELTPEPNAGMPSTSTPACGVVAVMSSDANENPLDRRNLLCGGGALVFSAMLASLLGGSKPVRAQTIAGSVPEVDRVSIRVVVDSYQFAVAAGKKVGPIDIQHFGWGLSLSLIHI